MSLFAQIAVTLALIAVAIVLLLGLMNMMKGGSGNRSQQLMRWRVILQAIAIVIVLLVAWIAGRA